MESSLYTECSECSECSEYRLAIVDWLDTQKPIPLPKKRSLPEKKDDELVFIEDGSDYSVNHHSQRQIVNEKERMIYLSVFSLSSLYSFSNLPNINRNQNQNNKLNWDHLLI